MTLARLGKVGPLEAKRGAQLNEVPTLIVNIGPLEAKRGAQLGCQSNAMSKFTKVMKLAICTMAMTGIVIAKSSLLQQRQQNNRSPPL